MYKFKVTKLIVMKMIKRNITFLDILKVDFVSMLIKFQGSMTYDMVVDAR